MRWSIECARPRTRAGCSSRCPQAQAFDFVEAKPDPRGALHASAWLVLVWVCVRTSRTMRTTVACSRVRDTVVVPQSTLAERRCATGPLPFCVLRQLAFALRGSVASLVAPFASVFWCADLTHADEPQPCSCIQMSLNGQAPQTAWHRAHCPCAGTLVNANDFELVVPSDFVDLGIPEVPKNSGARLPTRNKHSYSYNQHRMIYLLFPSACSWRTHPPARPCPTPFKPTQHILQAQRAGRRRRRRPPAPAGPLPMARAT